VTPNLVVAAVSQAAEGIEANAGTTLSMMGIYYSPNAGQTWYMATITDPGGNIIQSNQTVFQTRGNAVTSVVWNPVRQMFFAAVRFHGYYQSSDGMNWTRLAKQPGGGLTTAYCPTNQGSNGSPACPIFRGALVVQPVTGDMFALTTDLNNLDQGLWQDACALSGSTCSSATVTFANQIADTALEGRQRRLSATPASIDFGSYARGQTSAVQKVTLTNNGGVPLSTLNATVTGDFAISAMASTCGSTLAVKAQCQIGVVFTPSQGGLRTGVPLL